MRMSILWSTLHTTVLCNLHKNNMLAWKMKFLGLTFFTTPCLQAVDNLHDNVKLSLIMYTYLQHENVFLLNITRKQGILSCPNRVSMQNRDLTLMGQFIQAMH